MQLTKRCFITILFLFPSLLSVSCGNACQILSEKICKCDPTELEQRSCIQRVNADAGQHGDLTATEIQACENIIDAETCTCERLANHDLAACGLAR